MRTQPEGQQRTRRSSEVSDVRGHGSIGGPGIPSYSHVLLQTLETARFQGRNSQRGNEDQSRPFIMALRALAEEFLKGDTTTQT